MLPPLKIARAACCVLWVMSPGGRGLRMHWTFWCVMGPGSGGAPFWACETSHLDGPVAAGWVGGLGVYYPPLPGFGAFCGVGPLRWSFAVLLRG